MSRVKQSKSATQGERIMQPADSLTKETDPWDMADYYDCNCDRERLTLASPEEAIEQYLDGFMSPGCDVLKVIAMNTPLEVTAFVRKTVDPKDAQLWAARIADQVNEWWLDEEYGDPDGDMDGPGDLEFQNAVTAALEAAMKRTEIWACETVGERLFSEEEVVALMRDHCPDWFEDESDSAEPEESGSAS